MLITEQSRYLLIPTSKSAPKTKVYLREGDSLLLDLDACVDFTAAETVFYYDLTPFMGRNLTVSHESGCTFGFSEKTPDFPIDPLRPRLHFTARQGWLNDPNGLVYYEGRWHMFFQHNPVGLPWGNMHWGHAVSGDLIHWEERGDVLYPDELGDMFSGSAVIDSENLLGLKNNDHDPLLLFYTAAGNDRELNAGQPFTQCLAYSTDGAKTFHKFVGNPIVPHIEASNRDPKIVRDDMSGLYIMSLYLADDRYALLTSSNLTDWTQLQTISLPGDNECPDFFPLTDSDGSRKWVLSGAHDCYMVGDFDPERGFVSDGMVRKLGFGSPYAAQTFWGADRRIRIYWNRFNAIPSRQFNCAMSIPCELTLVNGALRINPVRELSDAWRTTEICENLPSHGLRREIGCPCDITLSLSKSEEPVTIMLHGSAITVDTVGGSIRIGEETMPYCAGKLRILADNYGVELFVGDGRIYGSFPLTAQNNLLTIGGEGSLDMLEIHEF